MEELRLMYHDNKKRFFILLGIFVVIICAVALSWHFFSGRTEKEQQTNMVKEQKKNVRLDEQKKVVKEEKKNESVPVPSVVPPRITTVPGKEILNKASARLPSHLPAAPAAAEENRTKTTEEPNLKEKEETQLSFKPVQAVSMPDPERIITPHDVNQISGKKVSFNAGKLIPGIEESDSYRSIYYTSKEKKENYGFGLQIWKLSDPLKAKQKYQDLLSTYPHAEEVTPVANQTFFAYWENILYLSFSYLKDNMVIVITCDKDICDSDAVYNLGKLIAGRLK